MLTKSRRASVAGIRSIRVGGLILTYLVDGRTSLPARHWLPGTTAEFWDDYAHDRYLDDCRALPAGVGALLIEDDATGEAMLIDAGVGPVSIETPSGLIAGGALLDSLRGVDRSGSGGTDLLSRITTVALTHLHLDQIGWLCRAVPGTDRRPFAHAAVVVGREEWAHRHLLAVDGVGPDLLAAFEPQVRLADPGQDIGLGVTVVPLPGHTPGHTGYRITSQGATLVVLGDALHTALQVADPQLSSVADMDPRQAADVRGSLVRMLADDEIPAFGMHFADEQFGLCARDSAGVIQWRPMPT
ncbi:MBL fold metallo-hydrolase [Nocardia sp. alder85J]|uniref:MBL fold metallo-hydrolase n=1 Tax=Nocardia sp. alder85J TaxID=2862949 RepID=UPI001CD1E1C9|nr:MBL fold metallo-hydrolase [Nocardia sp. alder85J]MCX4093891.1 MBL fold metallo-hydrolase [Nocardia sp. alder85J]